jgi:SEC-C motif-containing protein
VKSPCPCGLAAEYETCCGRWHAGEAAPTAEALMRSRYSAYVKGRADQLLATWHASTRPAEVPIEAGVKWLGLEVRRVVEQGNEATVEFVARSKLGGRALRLHENSRFVREGGRWYYVDGDLMK